MPQSSSTYIALRVEIPRTDPWLRELENALRREDVAQNLQKTPLHITIAFMPEQVNKLRVIHALSKVLRRHQPITITLNKLASFGTRSNEGIINLTSLGSNPEFYSLVEDIRKTITDLGYHIQHDFRLHVTVARASHFDDVLAKLNWAKVHVGDPSYTIKLDRLYFQRFKTSVPVFEWKLGSPVKTLCTALTLPLRSLCGKLKLKRKRKKRRPRKYKYIDPHW